MPNRFEYTDEDGGRFVAKPLPGVPYVLLACATPDGAAVPLDRLEEVIAGLRDMARQAGGQPEPVTVRFDLGAAAGETVRNAARAVAAFTPTPAPWPSCERWRVESLDPGSGEWAPGLALITRTAAVIKLDYLAKTAPTWRHDGSPVRRRIVRETTTYTVEEAGA